ncbi:MAG: hypothetical protein V6Z82_01805 [Flavobacteriales bacterium]
MFDFEPIRRIYAKIANLLSHLTVALRGFFPFEMACMPVGEGAESTGVRAVQF